MATSKSVTFKAEADKVWGAVVKLVTGAGYAVASTDQAAKQIVYRASGGVSTWEQSVQVSVTGVDECETTVIVLAEADEDSNDTVHAALMTLNEGRQQRKLVEFVLDELSKKFELAETQPQVMTAPGTSGCAVMVLVLTCVASTLTGAASRLFGG